MAAENLVGKQGDLTRPENCPRRPAITERFVLGSESTPLPLTAAPPGLPRPGRVILLPGQGLGFVLLFALVSLCPAHLRYYPASGSVS